MSNEAPLKDTQAVRDFMIAFDQVVRDTPTTDISDEERLLRARLVYEEALEFVDALGCHISYDGEIKITGDDRPIDLVEAADALADIIVVTKGSAHTLGIPIDEVFDIVHQTNMAKLGADDKPIKDEYGKVIKPCGWQPPTEAIKELLFRVSARPPLTHAQVFGTLHGMLYEGQHQTQVSKSELFESVIDIYEVESYQVKGIFDELVIAGVIIVDSSGDDPYLEINVEPIFNTLF